jgi:general secretion pathway protein G
MGRAKTGLVPPKPRRRGGEGGFTLIEMMVVIVIIGLIAGIAVVTLANRADKAKVEATKALIEQISTGIESFKLELNRYPDRIEDLMYMPPDIDPKKWPPGGFLKKLPKDGWDREFIYRRPGTRGQPYDLISYGEDGREGGESYAEDLWNHEAWKK